MKTKSFGAILKFILSVSVLFALTANAQSKLNENQHVNNKKEDQEVREFARTFVIKLEETKDIGKIPQSYFVRDFSNRFMKHEWCELIEESVFNALGENERYEFAYSAFNLVYLMSINIIGRYDLSKESEWPDIDSIEAVFPTSVLSMIKGSTFLRTMLDSNEDEDGDDIELRTAKTHKEFQELSAEFRRFNEAQRAYWIDWSIKQKMTHKKNLKELRKEYKVFRIDECEEDCGDLPQTTRVFNFHMYQFDLQIVKENGTMKIFDLGFDLH